MWHKYEGSMNFFRKDMVWDIGVQSHTMGWYGNCQDPIHLERDIPWDPCDDLEYD